MRKIAFGYSNRCNARCAHCVAAGDNHEDIKMDLSRAKEIIGDMVEAGVMGISFTAGEPFIYFDDLLELITLCWDANIYTRVVTNSYWAGTPEKADQRIKLLQECGLSQLRMSYSRWHQQNIPRQNVLNAARSCIAAGVKYFVSFVTDFSEKDDTYEQFLRNNGLIFFPEPVIYAGRANFFDREGIFTDYQENRCAMNSYLAPDLTMYACCDAGSHFNTTDFFKLGNLKNDSIDILFQKSETHQLYNCIRSMGITAIASFVGYTAREIVTYRKCELCKKMFDSPEMLKTLDVSTVMKLLNWAR